MGIKPIIYAMHVPVASTPFTIISQNIIVATLKTVKEYPFVFLILIGYQYKEEPFRNAIGF